MAWFPCQFWLWSYIPPFHIREPVLGLFIHNAVVCSSTLANWLFTLCVPSILSCSRVLSSLDLPQCCSSLVTQVGFSCRYYKYCSLCALGSLEMGWPMLCSFPRVQLHQSPSSRRLKLCYYCPNVSVQFFVHRGHAHWHISSTLTPQQSMPTWFNCLSSCSRTLHRGYRTLRFSN